MPLAGCLPTPDWLARGLLIVIIVGSVLIPAHDKHNLHHIEKGLARVTPKRITNRPQRMQLVPLRAKELTKVPAKGKLEVANRRIRLPKRRDIIIGITALAALCIFFYHPDAMAQNVEPEAVLAELKKKARESNLEAGIRALATAERQAVETVAEVTIDPNDGNEYWILKQNLKSEVTSRTASWLAKITNGGQPFRVLKRKVSDTEVILAGLAAGAFVEAARISLLHPLDTIKTRLQSYQRPKPPTIEELEERREKRIKELTYKIEVLDQQMKKRPPIREPFYPRKTIRGVRVLRRISLEEQLNKTLAKNLSEFEVRNKIPKEVFKSPWDGLGLALITSAPQGAVYWAVRDVVKRNLITAAPEAAVSEVTVSAVKPTAGFIFTKIASAIAAISAFVGPLAPALALDYKSVATLFAVTCGEAMYWLIRTPGEILKTQRQIEVLETGGKGKGVLSGFSFLNPRFLPSIMEIIRMYPILALVDLPQLIGRVWVFLILHNSPHTPSAQETDLLFYVIAAMFAAAICTPLDVARTRLLLQRQEDTERELARKRAEAAGRAAAQAAADAIDAISSGDEIATAPQQVQGGPAFATGFGNVSPMDSINQTQAADASALLMNIATNEKATDADPTASSDESREAIALRATRPSKNPRYDGIIDCLQKIWKDEGVRGLFAGFLIRMLWNGLVVGFILAIQRTSYEGVRALIFFRVLDQIRISDILAAADAAGLARPTPGLEEPTLPRVFAALGVMTKAAQNMQDFVILTAHNFMENLSNLGKQNQ
mmetsp:Transcript_22387/g.33352  ORF Transcript_22387/g.33352 Transcript_22387/m.33352 type:complete len:775 (+) Transcript_22387:159-2483(+)|eukprot:CAMPEP_0167754184 /NCGR_PEP_ID=MMETSP0110_2-20121227/8127_1 /TAXON_ID=629695 /ORGANISM="Gymnochlora sp., Strain CCMP2014" /LENGTH=774 /DNA_ID=CAMNT_0007640031 /DNA_START=155 /DNA_END=2479 /DNA_ORIENTATION=-